MDYRATYPELFRPQPGDYELQGASGKVYRMHAPSPGDACERAADLHGEPIVAWRTPRVALVPGYDPRRERITGPDGTVTA